MSTEYDLRQRDFFVTRSLGTGHSRPHDVLRTRRALNVTGHARSPSNPSKIFDPPLIFSLERFQRDWGLKDDTIINPGGPTEQTLELAVQATRDAGPDGAEMLRGPVKVLNQHGLRFARNPKDTLGPVLWRDRDGNEIPLDRVRRLLADADTSKDTEGARRGVQVASASHAGPLLAGTRPEYRKLAGRLFGTDTNLPAGSETHQEPEAQDNGQPSAADAKPAPSRSLLGASSEPVSAGSPGGPPSSPPNPPDEDRRDPAEGKLPAVLGSGTADTTTRRPNEPHQEFLDRVERTYWGYVQLGRERGWNQAADNLKRFLSGSGKDLRFTRDQARAFDTIRDAEAENNGRFANGTFLANTGKEDVKKTLRGLKDGQSDSIADHWDSETGHFGNARKLIGGDGDFVAAFGRTNVTSTVDVKVTRVGNQIRIEGTVTHVWDDAYDFERMQPFADGALALQKHRGAKPFKFGASWQQRVTGTVDIRNGRLTNPKIQWQDIGD